MIWPFTRRFDSASDFPEGRPGARSTGGQEFWLRLEEEKLRAWADASPLRVRWRHGVVAVRSLAGQGAPQTLLVVDRGRQRVREVALDFVESVEALEATAVSVTLARGWVDRLGLGSARVTLQLPEEDPSRPFMTRVETDEEEDRATALLALLAELGVAEALEHQAQAREREADEKRAQAARRDAYHNLYRRLGTELGWLGVEGELGEALLAAAAEHGIAEWGERLCGWASPSLRIYTAREASTRLGASRIGGAPDLAVGEPWPQNDAGLLTFVAQLRLQDLPHVPGLPLPKEGLLSFFSGDVFEGASARSVLFTSSADLERATQPPGLPFADEDVRTLTERGVSVRLEASLPSQGSVAFAGLGVEASDGAMAETLARVDGRDDGTNQLGGHANSLGGDVAQRLARGAGASVAKGDVAVKRGGAGVSEERVREALDWVCLFSCDSNPVTGTMWGDAGELQYWIRRSDLEARRFDRVEIVELSG